MPLKERTPPQDQMRLEKLMEIENKLLVVAGKIYALYSRSHNPNRIMPLENKKLLLEAVKILELRNEEQPSPNNQLLIIRYKTAALPLKVENNQKALNRAVLKAPKPKLIPTAYVNEPNFQIENRQLDCADLMIKLYTNALDILGNVPQEDKEVVRKAKEILEKRIKIGVPSFREKEYRDFINRIDLFLENF